MWTPLTLALLIPAALPPPSVPTRPALQEPDRAPAPSADELRERFVALEDEFDDARSDFFARLTETWEAHQADGKTAETFEYPDPIEPGFYPRFVALADEGSIDADVWCLSNARHSGSTGVAARTDKTQRTLRVLSGAATEEHLTAVSDFLLLEAYDDGSPGGLGSKLGYDAAFALLEVVRTLATTDEVRATTLYARGSAIKRSIHRPGRGVRTDEDAKAEAWFQRAATEYPDTETGARCGGLVFAARNLQIGQVAPDIVGKDHDGNVIKRSDFEGKVTVLDFWGFW